MYDKAPDLFCSPREPAEDPTMNTQHVLHQELNRLSTVEAQLAKSLLKVANAVQHRKLQRLLWHHFGETRRQRTQVKSAGDKLELALPGLPCTSVQLLIYDLHQVIATQPASATRDAMLAIKLRLIKGYQVTSYGIAYQCAHELGYAPLSELLRTIRQKEIAVEAKLGIVAVNLLTTLPGSDSFSTYVGSPSGSYSVG